MSSITERRDKRILRTLGDCQLKLHEIAHLAFDEHEATTTNRIRQLHDQITDLVSRIERISDSSICEDLLNDVVELLRESTEPVSMAKLFDAEYRLGHYILTQSHHVDGDIGIRPSVID